MKKTLLIVLSSIIIFVSCSKNNEFNDEQKLPTYNESNSTVSDWSDLPTELKNASALPSASLKSAVYSYTVGPWGGTGGIPFDIKPNTDATIYAIAIQSGNRIERIVVWYKLNGTIYIGLDKGGSAGIYYVQYFSDDEYIRRISGRSGSRVDRLSFETNRKTFTYGGTGGNPFEIATLPTNQQVLGFYGRSGNAIDKIGFYVYTH